MAAFLFGLQKCTEKDKKKEMPAPKPLDKCINARPLIEKISQVPECTLLLKPQNSQVTTEKITVKKMRNK